MKRTSGSKGWVPYSRRMKRARRYGMYARRTAEPMFRVSRTLAMVARTPGTKAVTERKYFDTYLDATALVAANTWAGCELDPAADLCLFAPAQGDDINERVGRKVTILKTTIRGFLHCIPQAAQATADAATIVRLILFLDMQTNATQVPAETLMQDPGAASNYLNTLTFQNNQNFGRFRVLRDKTIVLQNPSMAPNTDAGGAIVQSGLAKPFKISYKWPQGLQVRFNATNAGDITDIIDNSLHLIGAASNTGLGPNIYYQARTVYSDN